MGYEALVKKSWKSGEYSVEENTVQYPGRKDASPEESQDRARRQIESLAQREAGDAAYCISAHKEGIMKLAPFVKFREETFGAVLFETRSERVFTLSPTGAAVVREMITGVDTNALLARLKAKYEDKTGKMETETKTFLAGLKEKGLITE